MWHRHFRCLVSLLVALAFLGGATVQAMPLSDAALTATADATMPDCTEMAMAHDTQGPVPQKGISPDCVKLMQCLGVVDGPVHARVIEASFTYASVVYWSIGRRLNSRSYPPAPFPPRSA